MPDEIVDQMRQGMSEIGSPFARGDVLNPSSVQTALKRQNTVICAVGVKEGNQ
jgi:hypothetical protein